MKKSIKAAIQNIAGFGDTDIFPYTFEQHIFHDKPELLQKALEEIHKDFETHLAEHSPDNINTLAPVGYTGFRWATQIDPIWNAYYLALVIKMGEAIEKARIPVKENTVFSYRFISPLTNRMAASRGTPARRSRLSYSTARSWFHLAGFPVVHGVIFWQDFVQWRTSQNGFASQSEKLPHNNGVSTAATSKLPPRAAQILLDA